VFLGMAVVLFFQQQRIKRLMEENADLRAQLNQMASSRDGNGHLADELKATLERSQAIQNEVTRLRGQAVRLHQIERENAQLKAQRQQLDRQLEQQQGAVVSSEQPTAVVVSAPETSTETLPETDLGPLELKDGVAVHFDLGGGTNCVVTATALSDGTVSMRISSGLTNVDGTVSELATSRITARPSQHCSISVGDRMIALAVTLKTQ